MTDKPTSHPAQSNARRRWILYALVLVAGALRLCGLGDKSLWVDEIQSVLVSENIDDLIEYCTKGHTPPLRYLIVWATQQIPPTAFSIRLPAVVFGTLSIALMLWIGERLHDRRVGIVAALLLLLSPWHLLHSQDARYYAIILFLALAALGLAVRIAEEPRSLWRWIVLAIVCALNLYISYTAIFAVGPIGAWLLWCACRSLFERQARENRVGYLRGLGFAAAVGLICLLPWLTVWLGLYGRITGGVMPPKGAGQETVKSPAIPPAAQKEPEKPGPQQVLLWKTKYDSAYANDYLRKLSLEQPLGKWTILALFVIGLHRVFRDKRPFRSLVLLWFLLPWLVILATRIAYFVPPRYLVHYLGLYTLIAAVGAVAVWDWLKASLSGEAVAEAERTAHRVLFHGAVVVILLGILAGYVREDLRYMKSEKQDWQAAVRYLDENVSPLDGLLTGVFWTDRAVRYYLDQYRTLADPPLNVIPHCTQADKIELAAKSFPRLWYVTWGPVQPPDVVAVLARDFDQVARFPGSQGEIFVYRTKERTGGDSRG